jgi:putative acetyltransferase
MTTAAVPAAVVIERESPRQPDIAQMIEALDDYHRALYPAESNHLLDLEALAAPDIRFFVARSEGQALGCGALRVDLSGYGEVKRMFVVPQARGLRIGWLILRHIEDAARAEGLRALRLETGVHQAEALSLYRTQGYLECEPFAAYGPDPLSVFMEKALF